MKLKSIGNYAGLASARLQLAPFIACLALVFAIHPLSAQQAGGTATQPQPAAPPAEAYLTPDEALKKLMSGNERYVRNAASRPDQTPARRTQLALSQHPFAVILGCSDSRVAPEIIFDQGLGDLFVVRVAGNVIDDEGLGSLEYAVEHLHAPLIVVLGHTKCGAVTAAVSGEPAPGHIRAVVHALKPAVEATKGQPGDHVENAINANVQRVVDQLKNTKPILAEHIKMGTLKIVGGRYDLSSGTVELLDKGGH
jgi:carbonic anhydrase